MTEAAALPAREEPLGPPERLHPLYLLTGIPQALRGAWGLLVGGAVLATQGRWWIAVIMVIGFAVISIGTLFIRWLKLEYRVGAHELRIDSGWLSRTSRAIPFDRVTDVDLEQGPIHRLFGLARVKLETGGSAGGKEEEGVLHTISLERAEALREHIRARRIRDAVATPIESVADRPPLYAMDMRRVLTAGLFNFSLAVIAGLFGATQTIGDALGFDPFERQFWINLLAQSEPLRQLVIAHRFIAAIGGSLLLILIGTGTGLVRTMLREHGFRLDRTETGLRRRRGLLTLTDVSIPARRVQAAILTNGPVRRRFGWWVLKLQSLAQDGGKGDHVVAPLAREGEVDSILAELGWTAVPQVPWKRVSRAYVWILALGLSPLLLIAVAQAAGFSYAMLALGVTSDSVTDLAAAALASLALPVILAGAILVRWVAWRRTRFALSNDALFVEMGWWRHRRSMVPMRKIQSVDIAESWWSRVFGICTLRLGVAGGSGFSDHRVPGLTRPDAEALRAELLT